MKVRFRNTYRSVRSMAEASALFSAARDASGEGQSTWQDGYVVGRTGVVGRISYNGRIWPIEDDNAAPIYDPL